MYLQKYFDIRYVYGKPVAGKVRLSMNVTDEGGNSIYIMDLIRKEVSYILGILYILSIYISIFYLV